MCIPKKKPSFPRSNARKGPFVFMKWIFFEAEILGIHPFSSDLTFRGAKMIRTILSLSSIVILFLTLMKRYVDSFKDGPSMSVVAGFLNLTTFTILGLPVVIGHMKNSSYLKISLDKIVRVDDRLRSIFHVEYDYSSRRKTQNMIFWDALKIFIYLAAKAFSKRGFTIHESMNAVVRYYFLFATYNCSRQFVALGTIIIGHFKFFKNQIRSSRTLHLPNYLDTICLLHCEMVECCYLSIKWFNQRFFLITAIYFLGFMYNFCLILADVRKLVEENEVVDNFVYYSTWQFIRVYELWKLLSTCSSIEDEVAAFYEETTEILVNRNPYKLDTSSGILELFLAKQPDVQYWGSGFFRMDNSLLHSMAATLTTCNVIIVQYITSYTNSHGQ